MARDFQAETKRIWDRIRQLQYGLANGIEDEAQAKWETRKLFHDLQYVRSENPVPFTEPQPGAQTPDDEYDDYDDTWLGDDDEPYQDIELPVKPMPTETISEGNYDID